MEDISLVKKTNLNQNKCKSQWNRCWHLDAVPSIRSIPLCFIHFVVTNNFSFFKICNYNSNSIIISYILMPFILPNRVLSFSPKYQSRGLLPYESASELQLPDKFKRVPVSSSASLQAVCKPLQKKTKIFTRAAQASPHCILFITCLTCLHISVKMQSKVVYYLRHSWKNGNWKSTSVDKK